MIFARCSSNIGFRYTANHLRDSPTNIHQHPQSILDYFIVLNDFDQDFDFRPTPNGHFDQEKSTTWGCVPAEFRNFKQQQ